MNKGKSGIGLIILGNILYWLYIIFDGGRTTVLGDFTSGVLLGLSIGINVLGIILTVMYISDTKKDK